MSHLVQRLPSGASDDIPYKRKHVVYSDLELPRIPSFSHSDKKNNSSARLMCETHQSRSFSQYAAVC